jgi:hypothetical protein
LKTFKKFLNLTASIIITTACPNVGAENNAQLQGQALPVCISKLTPHQVPNGVFRNPSDREIVLIVDNDVLTAIYEKEIRNLIAKSARHPQIKIVTFPDTFDETEIGEWNNKIIVIISGFLFWGERHAYATEIAKHNVVAFLPLASSGLDLMKKAFSGEGQGCSLRGNGIITNNSQFKGTQWDKETGQAVRVSQIERTMFPLMVAPNTPTDLANMIEGRFDGELDGVLLPKTGLPTPDLSNRTAAETVKLFRSLLGPKMREIVLSFSGFPSLNIEDLRRLHPEISNDDIKAIVFESQVFERVESSKKWSSSTQLKLKEGIRSQFYDLLGIPKTIEALGYAAANCLTLKKALPHLEEALRHPEDFPGILALDHPDPDVRDFSLAVQQFNQRISGDFALKNILK